MFGQYYLSRMLGYISIFSLLICLILSSQAEAKPVPSPAGGKYVEFNSDDDFLSTVKPWLPNEKFQSLTVEGWIYLESIPDEGTYWALVGQENRFTITECNFVGTGFVIAVYGDENIMCSCLGTTPGLPTEKWTHFIVWYSPTVSYGIDGMGLPNILPKGFIFTSSSALRIGGIVPPREDRCGPARGNTFFRGYLDEIRISSIIRWEPFQGGYKVTKKQLAPDEDTLCLWHFDEDNEIKGYHDSSGNGWTLWKNEVFEVKSNDKLYTLWGKLKYE
jgi:hypothetical protein